MYNAEDEILLSAYLDGEVTAAEQQQIERLLVEDAGFRQLHDQLRALRHDLQSLPGLRLPADFSRQVLDAAERQMVAPAAAASSASSARSSTIPLSDLDQPRPRRWVRPLVWSSLAAAAAVLITIFGPHDRRPAARPVAHQDGIADAHIESGPPASGEVGRMSATPPADRSGKNQVAAQAPLHDGKEQKDKDASRQIETAKPMADGNAVVESRIEGRKPATADELERSAEASKVATRQPEPASELDRAEKNKSSQVADKKGEVVATSPGGLPPTLPAPATTSTSGTKTFDANPGQAGQKPDEKNLALNERATPGSPPIGTQPKGAAARDGDPVDLFERAAASAGPRKFAPYTLTCSATISASAARGKVFEHLLATVQPPPELHKQALPPGESENHPADSKPAVTKENTAKGSPVGTESGERTVETSPRTGAAAKPEYSYEELPSGRLVYQVDLPYEKLVDLLAQMRTRREDFTLGPMNRRLAVDVTKRTAALTGKPAGGDPAFDKLREALDVAEKAPARKPPDASKTGGKDSKGSATRPKDEGFSGTAGNRRDAERADPLPYARPGSTGARPQWSLGGSTTGQGKAKASDRGVASEDESEGEEAGPAASGEAGRQRVAPAKKLVALDDKTYHVRFVIRVAPARGAVEAPPAASVKQAEPAEPPPATK
ncbi:MAG: hypothetical protein K8T25_23495 [Planctomycetia bacterium]|nr:hypothetical protein [Planctomycetia bacterium]